MTPLLTVAYATWIFMRNALELRVVLWTILVISTKLCFDIA